MDGMRKQIVHVSQSTRVDCVKLCAEIMRTPEERKRRCNWLMANETEA